MMIRISRISLLVLALSLSLVTIFMVFHGVGMGASAGPLSGEVKDGEEKSSSGERYYLPLVTNHARQDEVQLSLAEVRDSQQVPRGRFKLGEEIYYVVSGMNHHWNGVEVGLDWQIQGPCGSTAIFSDRIPIPPGAWNHVTSELTPECIGSYLGTVELDYMGYTSSLTTTFEVHLPSQVVTSTVHGFDSCYFPTVSQMQTWWDESPYQVRNIYLGGINHGCSTADLNAPWVQEVAQQGWQFILTWVGLQPPCSNYNYYKFSSNYLTAYAQGMDEAAAALAVADSIGLSGEKIIYSDLEIYDGSDPTCKLATTYFVRGWTDWLHSTGNKAGIYAAPCYSNSNMIDWWIYNDPPPDDVWIAHWLHRNGYDPEANVWTSCLPDTYWPGYQRLRQYSGDYNESWGGVTIPIDSNIINGEVTAVTATLPSMNVILVSGDVEEDILEMDLVTPQVGWVLRGDELLWIDNEGDVWKEITPAIGSGLILDVDFVDAGMGWVVALQVDSSLKQAGKLEVYQTIDGGQNWELVSSFVPGEASIPLFGIAASHLDFLDADTGFLVVKHPSGSSFSQGSFYATQDGGRTWQRRTAPMGEPVVFRDTTNGWMTGGPTQDKVFSTQDGGFTWTQEDLPGLPGSRVFVGQPQLDDGDIWMLPVTVLVETDASLVIFRAGGSGEPWVQEQSTPLPTGYEPATALPFSMHQGRWWSGTPDLSRFISSVVGRPPTGLTSAGFPQGLVKIDFESETSGWALVQENNCFGDKIPANQDLPGSEPFSCVQRTRLYATWNGGETWQEIEID